MIRELQLKDFRGFSDFKLNGLERVNLLVGSNNSGKTSFLEAIELLLAHGDPRTIWRSLTRRGERIFGDEDGDVSRDLDVSHLFHGHEPVIETSFSVISNSIDGDEKLTGTIREFPSDESNPELFPDGRFNDYSSMGLHFDWSSSRKAEETLIPLTAKLGISIDSVRRSIARPQERRTPLAFVTTESLSEDEVISALSAVVFEPEEEFLLQALQILDPSIVRIAPVVESRTVSSSLPVRSRRGGVVIKVKDVQGRIPIGTMGDGIWHLLSLALSLVRARGGVLLVDEIDTGLHYSVMEDMWRVVQKTAHRLDVQVFATTHSSDCWKALAAVCSGESSASGRVSMQRIDRDKKESVPFSDREIVIAAEQGIEVR
jgi:energy-coupling factor transporter ATP-binding protein EcfA2